MRRNEKAVVTDSSDEAQIKKAVDIEKDRMKDLEWILSTNRGRRFIYELIYGTCHTRRLSHVPGAADTSAFNEGARAVGENLDATIRTHHFKAYILMLEENCDYQE